MRIYPIFMPHRGCPFQCVYCNQHAVTSTRIGGERGGEAGFLLREELRRLASDARHAGAPGEVAFYGGTFTALPPETIRELLDGVMEWVAEGLFTGIRFSTRPDAMTDGVCRLLREYPVRTVELGVQSLSDAVLARSRRGYSVETVERAAALVHENGWALGVQMMTGLPGDTRERFMSSISMAVRLAPALVRIYPTLVLRGTVLAEWYRTGAYEPLTLEEAIDWCVPAYETLIGAGIPVARMGLHSDPELEKPGRILAGPHHPSFGYLVRVRWWRGRIDGFFRSRPAPLKTERWVVRAPSRFVSEVLGPGRSNIAHWQETWGLGRVEVRGEPDWLPMRFECIPE